LVEDRNRTGGSTAEFKDDWRRVLETNDPRYLVYPSPITGRQLDFLEWIKAHQIVDLLREERIAVGRLLEYGCGAAGISIYMAKLGYESHICDLSPMALEVASRNRERNAPDISFASSVSANALELPYADGSFDVVMSFGLLEHFEPEPLNRLLADVIRVLKPAGLFIADIVPGPERLNARTIGIMASYVGSLGFHLLRGKWLRARELHRLYFDYYYENTHDDGLWASKLRQHGLCNVNVDVCRPFPPLALAGIAERAYTGVMRRSIEWHRRFDQANSWFVRRWGWMYFATARKPSIATPACTSP
jgi:SAM-dependent methyltransferase